MRRAIAGVIAVSLLSLVASVPIAHAGTSTDIALGLASFAVFNQVVGAFVAPRPVPAPVVVVAPPPVVYSPPPVVVTPPPVVYTPPLPPVVYAPPRPVVYAPAPVYAPARVVTPYQTVVQYPTGRYVLRVRGHHSTWVWIPNSAPVIVRPAY